MRIIVHSNVYKFGKLAYVKALFSSQLSIILNYTFSILNQTRILYQVRFEMNM